MIPIIEKTEYDGPERRKTPRRAATDAVLLAITSMLFVALLMLAVLTDSGEWLWAK